MSINRLAAAAMANYISNVQQKNFTKLYRAKHVLSQVEGTPRAQRKISSYLSELGVLFVLARGSIELSRNQNFNWNFKYLWLTFMLFVIGVGSGCGDPGAKRLPLSGFKVAFESHKVEAQMKSGETIAADVTIKNVSPVSWPSKPNSKNLHAVNLAYHWLDKKGQMVVFDGERTPLPYDLKPGESLKLKAAIHPPELPGAYILEITLVQEGVAWFPENGGAKLSLPVDVARAITTDEPVSNATAVKKRAAETAEKRPAPSALAGKADKPKGERGRDNGPWSVQIGSYPDKKRAEQSAKNLRDKGYDTYIITSMIKGQERHRVHVGHLSSREEAVKLRETLRSKENFLQAIVARPQ
jgi:hypothetical protein